MNTAFKELQDPEDEFINGLHVTAVVTKEFTAWNMEAPRQKDADYLITLHAWNKLPYIMPVHDAVNILCSLCQHHPLGMNKAALEQIIKDAILRNEISCWQLSDFGQWEKLECMPSFKPELTFFKNGDYQLRMYWISSDEEDRKNGKISNALNAAIIYAQDRIENHLQNLEQIAAEMYKEHLFWLSLVGIRLYELVQLLIKRQREIPLELKSFYQQHTEEFSIQPMPRSLAQEQAILMKISEMGYQAQALPKTSTGKPGVKSEIKRALGNKDIWTGKSVFDKAWQRLMAEGNIAYQE